MIGNALTPENRELTRQARVLLEALKDMKLRARAEKYKDEAADLWDLFEHLTGEVREATEILNGQYEAPGYPALSFALEIADIANCCDLIIAEYMGKIDLNMMAFYE